MAFSDSAILLRKNSHNSAKNKKGDFRKAKAVVIIMEKKKYSDPEIEVILLSGEDIITASSGDTETEEEDIVLPTH